MSGYYTPGFPPASGALLANARIPTDTNLPAGQNPQTAYVIPGTLPIPSGQEALTAKAGGGKSGATQLSYGLNRVSTVATAADSLLMPYAYPGAVVVLVQDGANSTTVFGKGTDTIDAVATATGNPTAAAKRVVFYGLTGTGDGSDVGTWASNAGAKTS